MMRDLHDSPTPRAPQLEVRHLRLVHAVTAEHSVTRAARRLSLSQSAVSHQLVDLEAALGQRLFDRVGKRMVPTTAGRRVLVAAERVLGELAAAETELRTGELRKRKLRITTSSYTSYHWLPGVVVALAEKHPDVEVDIVLEATKRAADALARDEVDLVITFEPPRAGKLVATRLFEGTLVALVRAGHRLASRAALRWWDLGGETIVTHDVSPETARQVEQAILRTRPAHGAVEAPRDVRRVPLTEAIVELVRAGMAIGLVGRWSVEPHLASGDIVAIPFTPRLQRTFYAVHGRANPRDLPFETFVSLAARAGGRRARH
jgi:LysR family transcriptional regulator for metE and metH